MSARLRVRAYLAKHTQEAKRRLLKAQLCCLHKDILHWSGNGSYTTHPRRLCLDCGLEEQGSWWSISTWRAEEGRTILSDKTGRTVRRTDNSDEFYRERVSP